MRTLAGVLLIVMCLINGIAGLGYLLGGALFNIGGEVAKEEAKVEEKDSKKQAVAAAMASDSAEKTVDQDIAAKEAKDSKELEDAGKNAKNLGAGLSAFGAFLGILAIGQIALAIMFFVNAKAAKITGLVIGGAGILAEVISIVLTKFGVTNGLGLVVGGLAIGAALMASAPATSAPPGGPAYPGAPPPP